jgi:AcrR family transcriptional regulator
MPRPYRLGVRKVSAEETRTRVLAAARQLLAISASPGGFSIESVARAAGVARMTVYYQFGTKAGLLQALFDDLAARGGMRELPAAFMAADPVEGLNRFIGTFCQFWASDQALFRRLQALAALDPDLSRELASREAGAQRGLRVLVARMAAAISNVEPAVLEELAAVLFTLTGFHAFDSLQRQLGGGAEEVAEVVRSLAHDAFGRYLQLSSRQSRTSS